MMTNSFVASLKMLLVIRSLENDQEDAEKCKKRWISISKEPTGGKWHS